MAIPRFPRVEVIEGVGFWVCIGSFWDLIISIGIN